ncbi:strictosidine synthase [Variovorax sp.]|uniref:strictosidine synthase n=1 Tax=Variovorax sp. TaxID=1871043 RepID=UPI003BACCE9A
MLDTLRGFTDRLLGRGSAAITVPVMDGVLKPNRALDNAEVVAELADIDDLAVADGVLWIAAGPALYRLDGGAPAEVRRFERPITALAAAPGGRLALALGGTQVLLLAPDGATAHTLAEAGGRALRCVNALAWDEAGRRWLLTEGSAEHAPERWCHDLMAHGASGRVCAWAPGGGAAQQLAAGLRHAFGVLPQAGGTVLVGESWAHRVIALGPNGAAPRVADLPGYPSRMAAAAGGGFWLSCFVCRTQLVEFVLREEAYRRRMVAEIDPRYWIAPALSSGHSFLEPLQGAGVKQMGVLKPWAPPRSYGLVVRVNVQGQVVSSLHSQVDGRHHGITAVAEHGGALFAASKGGGRLLRVRMTAEEQGAAR